MKHIDSEEISKNWTILLSGVIGVGLGVSGIFMYTPGLFFAAFEQEIGLSKTQFGLAFFFCTLALSIFNPFAGYLVDKFGSRRPALAGLLGLSVGFILAALLIQSVALYLLMQTLICILAVTSGPISFTKAVSEVFVKNRGLALGVMMSGIGISAAILPPVLSEIIAAYGWRWGYYLLACVALLGVVLVFVLFKPAPATPSTKSSTTPPKTPSPASPNTTERYASNPAFWLLMAAFSTMALAFAGLLPHFVPMLIDFGLSPLAAGKIAALIGIAVVASRLVVGWLLDHLDPRKVAASVCLICITGCAVLLLLGVGGAHVSALALGIAMGGEIDIIGFFTARYFSLSIFGRVYGRLYAAFILLAGLGPLWVGFSVDYSGNYQFALTACMLLLCLSIILFMSLPQSAKQTSRITPAVAPTIE